MTRPVGRDMAEHYTWGAGCDGWHLARRAETSIISERMPPGTAEAHHVHRAAWQFFFVLAGTATLEVGGDCFVLQTHEGLEVPPGVPHQMRNESAGDLDFLVFSQPPSHGDRVMVGR
ncbi:MAG TPA: cupin domain-containing protein [Ktedonobacterales bacterium]|nr:cupin domain-containing protein [Ktedonobacterales bacterium]